MRILVFNWRDVKNPARGGAEIYTHEIFKRLAKRGYKITLFTSEFKGCKKEEVVDGIKIVRCGGKYFVYRNAKKFYKDSKFDLVIDEINTIPFFTPKFVEIPVVALIHQLCREFWFYETPFPLSFFGYMLENSWLKMYSRIPTITVSDSTKNDLIRLGFENVFVVPNGINVQLLEKLPEKAEKPTILFLGRMKKAKKPGDVVKALGEVRKRIEAELWMVGDGYLRKKLEKFAGKNVKFFGYVDERTKWELVRKAWVLAVPGVREGWGQVVTDACALGTPAVGYNIHGLRDSIVDGKTGLLVQPNPKELAAALVTLLENKKLRKKLGRNALSHARKFSWDRSAKKFERIIGEFA